MLASWILNRVWYEMGMDSASSIRFPGLLDWPNCVNVRDIGGLPTGDGRQIRRGELVRADSLERLNPAGMAAAQDYGVTTIVDLRSRWELSTVAHPFSADPGYWFVPFIDAARDTERNRSIEHTRADLYRGSIDRNGRSIAAALTIIADAPTGAIVVHCLSGADRTGMFIAMLLDALGVERSAILQDYDRTRECLTVDPGPDGLPLEPDTMEQTLRHVDTRWDGSRAYLERNGFSAFQLGILRDRLVA